MMLLPGPWPQGDVRMPGVLSASPPATFSYSWKKLLDSLLANSSSSFRAR